MITRTAVRATDLTSRRAPAPLQALPRTAQHLVGSWYLSRHRVLLLVSHDGAINVVDDRAGGGGDAVIMRGVSGAHR